MSDNYIETDGIVDIILYCPMCHERHYDEGEWETKPHHTHACQHCGFCWRPAVVDTRGVRFLPGFKNRPLIGDDSWMCEACKQCWEWDDETPAWRDSEGVNLCEECFTDETT